MEYHLFDYQEEIVTTSYIAAVYLEQIGFKGTVYLMGLAESIGAELDRVGIKYIGPGVCKLSVLYSCSLYHC